MRGTDGLSLSNVAASGAAAPLAGGRYLLTAVATWGGGSVGVSILGPDGSTYLTVGTALTANGVAAVIELPACTAKLVVATATAVYASLSRIPGE